VRENTSQVTVFPATELTRYDHKVSDLHKKHGVSPWELEYQPNPVIFSHLKPSSPSLQPLLSEYPESSYETSSNDIESISTASIAESSVSSRNDTATLSNVSDSGSSRTSHDGRSIDFSPKKLGGGSHE